MSKQTKAMLKSWLNVFLAAVITALSVVFVETKTLALDWQTIEAVIIAGIIAVLPVIKNYFDKGDSRYGKGAISE